MINKKVSNHKTNYNLEEETNLRVKPTKKTSSQILKILIEIKLSKKEDQ